ncbi:hypothetical protein NA256_02555 [Salmonella sp. NW805]|uniref:hypothetical protein n=1 Tax=unclassified Salmonella TaxID=2614656 RepID=UPI003F43D91A|nr:hypothetical protein [Salmonella enterica]HBM0503475.1 hypothetical protein [Salmonella enterica]
MSALKKLTAITLPQEIVAVPELGEDAEIIIRQMSVGYLLYTPSNRGRVLVFIVIS